jgi:hypothetical protein
MAGAYALVSSLRLTGARKRRGEPMDEHWVAARQKDLGQCLDELGPGDRLTELGRLLYSRLDSRSNISDTVG